MVSVFVGLLVCSEMKQPHKSGVLSGFEWSLYQASRDSACHWRDECWQACEGPAQNYYKHPMYLPPCVVIPPLQGQNQALSPACKTGSPIKFSARSWGMFVILNVSIELFDRYEVQMCFMETVLHYKWFKQTDCNVFPGNGFPGVDCNIKLY